MLDVKELSSEELDKITGGSTPSEGYAYMVLLLAGAIELQYKSWLESEPKASLEKRYQQIKVIADKICTALLKGRKSDFEKFLKENSFNWDEMLNNIVRNN